MTKLITFDKEKVSVIASNNTQISNIRFTFNQVILNNDDNVSPYHMETAVLPKPVKIMAYETITTPQVGEAILLHKDLPLVRFVSIRPSLKNDIIESAYRRLKSLPEGQNEIWPSDHNVTEGYHIADPWGEPTQVLRALEDEMDVIRPPENHNKLASKSFNRYSLDELHIDSFVGMERDYDGKKLRIWRTFYNLGNADRTTIIGIHDPNFVDDLSQEELSHSYLPKLAERLDNVIPTLLLSIPPRNKVTGEVFGFEILTTNLLHGEYGPKDDYIAIINSLKPTERYGDDKKFTF